jgi:hypothetical protein
MSEEDQERIGEIVDRIRSTIAGAKLGLPAEQKLEYTIKILADIQSDLRAIVVNSGMEDWWAGRDAEIQ